MDFMKVFDQTVREIKREVNLKVLKVPEIEQKVLDATDNEPWGPHGTALAEIAQATKKFADCQMVMNVLWTRLVEIGKDWRYVYKALTVIEYLVANGSERAVDDIIEHTFQISSLSSFEHVEPNGKDMGINVRKKAETIVGLLNNKDKIQEVRNKAASNREKYFGLSSSGITYKSGSSSLGGGGGVSSFSGDRYGGMGNTREYDSFRDSYKDKDQFGEDKFDKDTSAKSKKGVAKDNQEKSMKNGSTRYGSKDQDNYASISSQSANEPSINYDEEFDDFDPRGTSTTKPAAGSSNQVDLFGDSLIGDLMDVPTPVPTATSANSADVDLFADATFVSASASAAAGSGPQTKVNLFASEPTIPPASSSVDFFSAPDPIAPAEIKDTKSESFSSNMVDPFASVPLNNFDGSDVFGTFTSHPAVAPQGSTHSSISDDSLNNLGGKPSVESKPVPKKNAFQVKSGIWADSLSRGLIDLNITAPKKVDLADVGVVGGLSNATNEREKGPLPSYYMGSAMGSGSGLGRSGFTTSAAADEDFFSSLGSSQQQYQFGGFQK